MRSKRTPELWSLVETPRMLKQWVVIDIPGTNPLELWREKSLSWKVGYLCSKYFLHIVLLNLYLKNGLVVVGWLSLTFCSWKLQYETIYIVKFVLMNYTWKCYK